MDIDKLSRRDRWALADRLSAENLDEVNSNCEAVKFRETFYINHMKRWMDIIISSIALVVTLPINIIVVVATFFDVGRPLIYSQERIGKDEKPFNLIKFRNMTCETDKDGELLPAHMRVTKWGGFVRKTSIDELLNFWSILKGNMSVIGPRPLPEIYRNRLNKRHKGRFFLRPGLECPPKNISSGVRSWNDQFENDIWYVENVSFSTDVMMIARLLRMIVNKKYANVRSHVERGDFLGYSKEGVAISQYDLPHDYIERVLSQNSDYEKQSA